MSSTRNLHNHTHRTGLEASYHWRPDKTFPAGEPDFDALSIFHDGQYGSQTAVDKIQVFNRPIYFVQNSVNRDVREVRSVSSTSTLFPSFMTVNTEARPPSIKYRSSIGRFTSFKTV